MKEERLDAATAQDVRNSLRTVVAATTFERDAQNPMGAAADTANATDKAFSLMRNAFEERRKEVDAMPGVESSKQQIDVVSYWECKIG